jgi:hypothetical protein
MRPTHAKCHNHDFAMSFMPEFVPGLSVVIYPYSNPSLVRLSYGIPTLIAVPARMCMHPNPSIYPNSKNENRCVCTGVAMRSDTLYATVDAGRS